uniref:Cathepsin L n=1 Tax=Sexangularia sp. CB-2014 TaxID=1486929 RepID=A0A7S1VFT7_9EUKA
MFVLALAASTALASPIQSAFKEFTATHNKVYDDAEFAHRFSVFADNYKFVQEHNALGRSYTVGLNLFADLTNEEFVRMYTGYKYKEAEGPFATFDATALPDKVDWTAKGAVTPVKNQGACGSCWSFSATGSMEGAHFLAGNKLVGLSEQNLVDCSTAQGNMGCNGGLMDDAFQYVITNKGIDSESSYPYTATGPNTCQFDASNVAATIDSYTDVASGDENALMQAAASIGPISVAIDASHSSFQFYSGGVYSEPACSSSQLDHGVLVVGYGTYQGSTKYWLVKNSWGASWGVQGGYIMMSRDANNQCGIATSASYPVINSRK